MKPDEMLSFGREGGIGTCISLVNVEAGTDLLPCKIGDVITILKPIKENLYLGFLIDQVGHFRLEDVNLIYLNLSVASPRKNHDKYLSFTALLEKDVPTGFYGDNNLIATTKSNLDVLSEESINEETEAEISMENLQNSSIENINALSITPTTSHGFSKEINKSQNGKKSIYSSSNGNSLDMQIPSGKLNFEVSKEEVCKKLDMVDSNDHNLSTYSTLKSNMTNGDIQFPTTKEDHANGLDKKVNFSVSNNLESLDKNLDCISGKLEDTSISKSNGHKLEVPKIDISTNHLKEQNKMDTHFSNGDRHITNHEEKPKGLFNSIKIFKKKADNLILSVKLDPSLVLLPTSGIINDTSGDVNFAAKSESMRKFYSQANEKGDSIVLDQFGFIQSISDDEGDDAKSIMSAISGVSNLSSTKSDRLFKYELTKESKWRAIINKWSPSKARKSYRVKKLVEKGIPEGLRGKTWSFLANVQQFKKAGVYKEMLEREKIPIYDVIERDIRRTYPKHSLFYYENSQGLKDLYSILKAYAQYNPDVGYCQGMGMLVGLYLMQNLNEEDAFWLLVATNSQYLQGYFTPTLSQLRIHSAVFEYLLAEHDPKLAKHLSDNDITSLLYVTPWFLTVYTMTLPWTSVLLVWDLFYYKGIKILFRVGLAIMSCVRSHIFKNCPTAAELLPFLLHVPHEFLEPKRLMEAYKNVKLTTSHIQSLCRRVASPDGSVPDRGALQVRN